MNGDIFRRRPSFSPGEVPPGKFLLSAGSLCLIVLFLLVNPSRPVRASGQEETVHLSLQKRVYREEKGKVYTVRKGDWIFRIIRKTFNSPPGDEGKILEILRAMNPDIKNFDKIIPGQQIYLPSPGKEGSGDEKNAAPVKKKASVEAKAYPREETVSYKVRRGDTVSDILVYRFGYPKSRLDLLLTRVKGLNPGLSELDRIYPGQVLRFPGASQAWRSGGAGMKEIQEVSDGNPGKILPALREILRYIDARLETKGVYYIPIVPSGLITLSCERFPVVEFSNGKRIVLNLSGKMESPLKEMLQTAWEDCSVLDPPGEGDFRSTLDGIVSLSSTHKIEKMEDLTETGGNPRIRVRIDRMIVPGQAGKGRAAGGLALRYVRSREELLTENLKRYLRDRGVSVVEIMEGKEIVEIATGDFFGGRTAVHLQGETPIDLAGSFLSFLGFSVVRNEDLFFSDPSEGRIGLSIKADLYATKGEVRLALFSGDLHQALEERMTERGLLFETISAKKDRKETLERLMTILNLSFHSGDHLFSLPGTGGDSIRLSSIRLDRADGALHFVDGEMGSDLVGYLMEKQGVKVVTF